MRIFAIIFYFFTAIVVPACPLFTGPLFIGPVFIGPVFAGQVVTNDTRKWAQNALKQEKTLKTVSMPNTLAVLYFNNSTGDPGFDLLKKGLALMLMTDLSRVEKIRMVERVKVQALVEELGYQTSGLTGPETATRMGKLMGAEFLVGGDIVKEKKDGFLLSSTLLKVPLEEISGRPEIRGQLLEELFIMEKKLLFDIIKLLKIELDEKQKQDLQKPFTTDVRAFLYFMQGIEESDKGNFRKADSLYRKAVEHDSDLTPAREASKELLNIGLIKPRVKRRILLKDQKSRTSYTDKLAPNYPNKRMKFPKNIIQTCEIQIDWETIPQDQ